MYQTRMDILYEKEAERFRLQKALDALKTQGDRNRLGQFSTPFSLAVDIIKTARLYISETQQIDFLDPAFGTGVFFSALCTQFNKEKINRAVGVEIDTHYFDPTNDFWSDEDIELINGDFTSMEKIREEGFNLLVANPPYVRHHHIEMQTKKMLMNQVLRQFGIRPSGLSGLYCYFIYLSVQHLSEGGIGCWLVPSEFLDVNYGSGVKELLLSSGIELLRIHRYLAENVQFEDALVSSCILFFRRISNYSQSQVAFTQGTSLESPAETQIIDRKELNPSDKWNQLFSDRLKQNRRIDNSDYSDTIELGEIFKVKRGIATGSNKFFVMTPEKIRELGFSRKYFRPILPSPRALKCTEIETGKNNMPDIPNGLLLLDVRVPLESIRNEDPLLYEYIASAPKEVTEGYLCSKRKPWYAQERRDPPPMLCTYMSRNTNGKAFRFIRNKSSAIASNSYLLLYPKWRTSLDDHAIDLIHEYLSNMDSSELILGGRVYGGGLHKLEPQELMRIRVPAQLAQEWVELHDQLPISII